MKKYTGPFGMIRAYVYDVDTGEQIGNPLVWLGLSECGIWRGARWFGTALSVEGADVATREWLTLTAESFPGRRVAVKVWYGKNEVEWRALVSRARGWQGNEAARADMPRREYDVSRKIKRAS